MRRLMNFLLGTVRVRFTGPFPERLINLCAQNGVEFWGVEWPDERTVRLTLRRRGLKELEELAGRVDCRVEREGSRGLPDFLGKFRARYAFLLGLAFALCAVTVLSRFVLVIQVTGNETVPTAVILSQLRQLGVRPGVYGPSLDRKQLAQEALLELDGLSWMALNLYGTRLEVVVREAVKAPERLDTAENVDLIAEADGIVVKVEPELGDRLVEPGDTVAAGDILISGTVTLEPPLYSDAPERYYQVHARGRVWARTWRTLTAAVPLEAQVKEYTGQEKSAWAVQLFGRRVEIFGTTSISWSEYDKITTVRQAALPSGDPLPLSLVRETAREYVPRTVQVDREAARALLEEELLARLEEQIGPDGTVSAYQCTARETGGRLEVTLTAECREEICAEQPGRPLPPSGEATSPS